jgi:hypothetical protein
LNSNRGPPKPLASERGATRKQLLPPQKSLIKD